MNENNTTKNAPWVEKYRPKNFENIVLDPINRQIFTNILEKNYFPIFFADNIYFNIFF